jgi:hypothetical protein
VTGHVRWAHLVDSRDRNQANYERRIVLHVAAKDRGVTAISEGRSPSNAKSLFSCEVVSHDRAVVAVPVPIDAMDVVTWLLDDLGRQAVTQSLKSLTGRKCLRNDPF